MVSFWQGTWCYCGDEDVDVGLLKKKPLCDLQVGTSVSEELLSSILWFDDGGSMFVGNFGIYLQVHTALLSRRPK
jgi:hypothetical protein